MATLPPQRPPRKGWEEVAPYNASLPSTVAASQAAGLRVTLVEMHRQIGADDLLPDGVHPNAEGMITMAGIWFEALQAEGYIPTPRKP